MAPGRRFSQCSIMSAWSCTAHDTPPSRNPQASSGNRAGAPPNSRPRQAASFAAGLRRALDPAHLNRIRFEMRRELKRARKQRRADARQARREYEARQRAGDAAA